MLSACTLALTLGGASSFVVNGIPAYGGAAVPAVRMSAESAAKAKWLARTESNPSWVSKTSSASSMVRTYAGSVVPNQLAGDDHTNSGDRSRFSGPPMGHVPIATYKGGATTMVGDDHTNSGDRTRFSGPPMGHVPIATYKGRGGAAMVGDDHTNSGDRSRLSGPPMGHLPVV